MSLLKQADEKLAGYKVIAQKVAAELAKRKSMYVFGKEGGYRGDLGCWEAGADVICLHIEDEFRGESYKEYQEKSEKKAYDFEGEWVRKVLEANIHNVFISGHM